MIATAPNQANLACLQELQRKPLWLASWTIHNANHMQCDAEGAPDEQNWLRRPAVTSADRLHAGWTI
jgi:hypothetical protein